MESLQNHLLINKTKQIFFYLIAVFLLELSIILLCWRCAFLCSRFSSSVIYSNLWDSRVTSGWPRLTFVAQMNNVRSLLHALWTCRKSSTIHFRWNFFVWFLMHWAGKPVMEKSFDILLKCTPDFLQSRTVLTLMSQHPEGTSGEDHSLHMSLSQAGQWRE